MGGHDKRKGSSDSHKVIDEKMPDHSKKQDDDETYDAAYLNDADLMIEVPSDYAKGFNMRTLWAFTGPGWLMSIAYLDPGNIEADMQSGVIAGYKLLWVLMWATVLGLMFQRLAARLGVVTGKHLAQVAYDSYPKVPRVMLWIMVEVAIIGSDMQEVIGTAIAIFILSKQTIPLWAGTLITIFDTFTFLFLDKYGLRKLEYFFAFLIGIMAISFGIEYFVELPDQVEVIKGIVIPWCKDCGSEELMQAVSAIGAVIMPHNFYLHSALVKTRKIDRDSKKGVSEANKYYFIESAISLFISFIINLLVIAVFATAMYDSDLGQTITYETAIDTCNNRSNVGNFIEAFTYDVTEGDKNLNDTVESDLYKGGVYLGCLYGMYCTYIWAVGILASGQSSTMTGTYSGQFAMEGFLNMKWKRWQRVLLTRAIAITPTFAVAYFLDINHMTGMNDTLNAVMAIQLPFAIIPCLTFTSSRPLMGDFANGLKMKIFLSIMSLVIIAINMGYVYGYVYNLPREWWIFTFVAVYGTFYLVFIGYLTIYLLICMGFESLAQYKFVQDYWWVEQFVSKDNKISNEYSRAA